MENNQGRLQKWEWKPALAPMYPDHCFFAVVSVCPLLEANISGVPTVFSYLKTSWFLAVHKGQKVISCNWK